MSHVDIARVLIASGVTTPFLAVDRDVLRANLTRWHWYLPDVKPHYAVKANIDPLVLRELFNGGADADVASAFEMDVCRSLGLYGDRMIPSHPRKDPETVTVMKHGRPWGTAVDSEEEVEKLADAGIPGDGYDPILFVRIKVPTEGVVQDLSSKFGIRVLAPPSEPGGKGLLQLVEVGSVFRRAREAGFTRFGLSFHVGTQCANASVYEGALNVCRQVADGLKHVGVEIGWLDIGGGFADGRVTAESVVSRLASTPNPAGVSPHDGILESVGLACRQSVRNGVIMLAEPGRYMVADAGFLVTRIVYDRTTELTGRRVQIDDGVYRTLSAVVHDGRQFAFRAFRAGPSPRPFLEQMSRFILWGCSCDSFDKVAEEVLLPADLGVGDFLMTECVGAYSTSFGSNTNGFAPAPVVLYWQEDGELLWEISPMARQNELILDHIRRWAATSGKAPASL